MPSMDGMANGGVESPMSSPGAAPPIKGRGLRRWRRIRPKQQPEGNTSAAAAAAGDGSTSNGSCPGHEGSVAQQHKRRIPLPAGAPKAKHESHPVAEAESSTASVESRFVPHAPASLDPGLASAGFAIGADSDDEDRSGRSSTGVSAPRALSRHSHGHGHDKHLRAARSRGDRLWVGHAAAGSTGAENSRSSVESGLRSSNARRSGVNITGNGVHKGSSNSGDHSDEGQRSEEVISEDVRSTAAGGYYEENGSSLLGRLAHGSSDNSDDDVGDTSDEGSMRNGENGGLNLDADTYAESVLLLQKTQEALENEIEKIMAVGEVPSDEFDNYDEECNGSVHLGEPIEEVSERIKHLESRLKEASELIKEKDARMLELGTLSRSQAAGTTAIDATNLSLSESELDELYQEKTQTEIQFIILTEAYQTLATLADDQIALYEAQKSLSEDYKQLELKLRHAENRAMVLEEKAEKLQVQCKELSRSSEVLQLQSKASQTSLFCFVQFILLCMAVGTYLVRLVPSSTSEVVPT